VKLPLQERQVAGSVHVLMEQAYRQQPGNGLTITQVSDVLVQRDGFFPDAIEPPRFDYGRGRLAEVPEAMRVFQVIIHVDLPDVELFRVTGGEDDRRFQRLVAEQVGTLRGKSQVYAGFRPVPQRGPPGDIVLGPASAYRLSV